MRIKRIVIYSFTVLLAASPLVVIWQRQNIFDWWTLKGYQPPAAIVDLANATTMTPKATKIFYVTKPRILSKSEFQSYCESTEKTSVLGCYKGSDGIFVYDVSDSRLAGVEEVTAAHEMLHAAYDRLSSSEKTKINALTQTTYESLKDERIRKNVDAYRESDPTVVPNELHSILGTEVAQLPQELETYYKRYFTDRAKIVAYSVQYESEFTKREAEIATYDAQLESLKATIDASKASLAAQGTALEAESDRLDNLRANNQISEYNAGIPGYRRMVNAYNSEVDKLKTVIANYNQIIDKRNEVAATEKELYKALDTRVPESK